ncbi:MAG TPA: hypothetical protein VIS49_10825 [Cyclobacteriaceae bacterium]
MCCGEDNQKMAFVFLVPEKKIFTVQARYMVAMYGEIFRGEYSYVFMPLIGDAIGSKEVFYRGHEVNPKAISIIIRSNHSGNIRSDSLKIAWLSHS